MAAHALLSHPFRLGPNGSVATVGQDTDAGDKEQIAMLVLTHLGERPLVPGFGITDPAFSGFAASELVAGVAAFGPPVTIERVSARAVSSTEQVVEVEFS